MFTGRCHTFFYCWLLRFNPMLEVMLNLIKYPWIANTSATNHNSVNAIFVFVLKSFWSAINIAITKNRNMKSWVVFRFSDQRPIRFSFVHLLTSPPMNGDGLNAHVL